MPPPTAHTLKPATDPVKSAHAAGLRYVNPDSAAIERVAALLGNTRAVCRKCYIHPAIIESYLDRTLAESLKRRAEQKLTRSLHHLRGEEAAVLALLQERLKREAATRRKAA